MDCFSFRRPRVHGASAGHDHGGRQLIDMALFCVEYTHEHMGEKRRDARGTTLQTTRPLSLGNWVSTTGLLVLMSLSRKVHARIVLCWRSFSWNLLARLLFLAVDIVTHVCTRLVASKLHICSSISSVKGPIFTCYISWPSPYYAASTFPRRCSWSLRMRSLAPKRQLHLSEFPTTGFVY